jgi:hypothetical protein
MRNTKALRMRRVRKRSLKFQIPSSRFQVKVSGAGKELD